MSTKSAPSKWGELYMGRIGHDTEFFLETPRGRVVPSYEFFKQKTEEPVRFLPRSAYDTGSKYLPFPENLPQERKDWLRRVPAANTMMQVFRDGLAVEFNGVPATCRGFLWNDQVVATNMASWRLPKGVRFTTKPVMRVTRELVKSFPPDLKVLGCSPTQDAYTGTVKSLGGVDPLKLPFRTSGAHLHMSFESLATGKPVPIPAHLWAPFIKVADLLIGVPFTYVFGDELEFKRRTLYGTAGEFRRQIYPSGYQGLEYRTLSSRLWNHPMTFSLFTGIWKYILGTTSITEALIEKWDPAWEPDIQAAINLGDEVALKKMLEVGAKLYPFQDSNALTTYSASKPDVLKIWAGLREWRKMGKLNTFALMDPVVPEGHYGWQHYSNYSEFTGVVRNAKL